MCISSITTQLKLRYLVHPYLKLYRYEFKFGPTFCCCWLSYAWCLEFFKYFIAIFFYPLMASRQWNHKSTWKTLKIQPHTYILYTLVLKYLYKVKSNLVFMHVRTVGSLRRATSTLLIWWLELWWIPPFLWCSFQPVMQMIGLVQTSLSMPSWLWASQWWLL